MRDLLVSRVDLAVVEGTDSHDDADVVVALAVRLGDSVRRHTREAGGGQSPTMGRIGLESNAFWVSPRLREFVASRLCQPWRKIPRPVPQTVLSRHVCKDNLPKKMRSLEYFGAFEALECLAALCGCVVEGAREEKAPSSHRRRRPPDFPLTHLALGVI